MAGFLLLTIDDIFLHIAYTQEIKKDNILPYHRNALILMVGGSGIISNQKKENLPENSRNHKESEIALSTTFSAETCRELFDTLAQWNSYLEDHVPYFQTQTQEPTP